jgi:hypothetical protein
VLENRTGEALTQIRSLMGNVRNGTEPLRTRDVNPAKINGRTLVVGKWHADAQRAAARRNTILSTLS